MHEFVQTVKNYMIMKYQYRYPEWNFEKYLEIYQ